MESTLEMMQWGGGEDLEQNFFSKAFASAFSFE
jgi:hypothetical protein